MIHTDLMILLQSKHTYYVNYNAVISIVVQMHIMSLQLTFHQPHLKLDDIDELIKYENKIAYIRGVNGGLSNGFNEHPLTDP